MGRTRLLLALLILAVTGIPFLAVLARGHTLGPWDQVGPMATLSPTPGQSEKAWDVLQADACLQFYPWRDLVFESWAARRVPFWNAYSLGGTPLLANSQSGGFYPPHVIWGLLRGVLGPSVCSTGFAIVLLAWFHCAVAAAGVAFAGRKLGGNLNVGVIAGLGFALSPFFMAWAPLGSVISTVAWIPWALGFGVVLLDGLRAKAAAGLAVSVALMLTAGHLQFAAFGFMGLVVIWSILAIARRRFLGLALALGGLMVGSMLAAPQLLPVLTYSKLSHRQTTATEEGFAAYRRTSLGGSELVAFLDPRLLGDPQKVDPDAPVPGISGFRPLRTIPGANYAEFAVGLGLVLLAMCFFVRRIEKPVGVAIGATALLGSLFAVGHPALRILYFGFPGWAATGSPTRGGVLFLLAGALLATQMQRPRQPIALGLFAAAALLFSFWVPVRSGKLPDLSEETALPGRTAAMNSKWSMALVPNAFLPPNTMLLPRNGVRMMDVGGYDSLMSRDTVAWLRDINGTDPAPPENGNMMFIKPTADQAKLAAAGVSQILVRTPDGPAIVPIANPAPLVSLDGGDVADWRIVAGGIEVDPGGRSGALTVLQRYAYGWSAKQGNRVVAGTNDDGWLRFDGLTGSGRISLSYVAPGYRMGLTCCLIGVLVLVGGLLFERRSGEKPPENLEFSTGE